MCSLIINNELKLPWCHGTQSAWEFQFMAGSEGSWDLALEFVGMQLQK